MWSTNGTLGLTNAGKHSAYILLLRPDEQDIQTVADKMFMGLHGFICEPFSVDVINEIARIANSVRYKEPKEIFKAAAGLMLADLFNETGKKGDKLSLWDKVQASYTLYEELTGESFDSFMENNLKDLRSSSDIPIYKGLSQRVREFFLEKIEQKIGHYIVAGKYRPVISEI